MIVRLQLVSRISLAALVLDLLLIFLSSDSLLPASSSTPDMASPSPSSSSTSSLSLDSSDSGVGSLIGAAFFLDEPVEASFCFFSDPDLTAATALGASLRLIPTIVLRCMSNVQMSVSGQRLDPGKKTWPMESYPDRLFLPRQILHISALSCPTTTSYSCHQQFA